MGIMPKKDSDMADWQKQRSDRSARLSAGSHYASGKMVPPDKAKAFLEAVIRPGDRVCLEGDNQKQADFLAEALADREGNLYTGPNTEDTPTIVEATAFKSGIVVAQVNKVVDKLPRVDIPADQVDFIN